MVRHTASSRIPGWFNLEAYSQLPVLDASGWLKVLVDLHMILECDAADFVDETADGALAMDVIEGMFTQFQLGSSRDVYDWLKEKYAVDPAVYDFGTTQSLNNWTVARMGATLERLDRGKEFMRGMRRLVDQDLRRDYKGLNRAHRRLDAFRDFSEQPFFVALRDSTLRSDSGKALTTNRAISVDMSAPDDIILADFKSWLGEMRKLEHHRAARRSFTEADYQKWARNGYVPLLLLDKWRVLTGVKITLGDLCDAAFPDGRRVEVDDLRKTLLPNAYSWATKETIEALAAQASRQGANPIAEDREG